MKKISKNIFHLAIALLMSVAISGCDKDEFDDHAVLVKIHKNFEDAEISKGTHNNRTVYLISPNSYDAGSFVYDTNGSKIGVCAYAWGHVDPICQQLTLVEVVYRAKDNMWGLPAIDKYGLALFARQ